MPDEEDLFAETEGLRRLVRSLVRSECDVEDVVQEVRLRALCGSTNSVKSRPAWLATVARNVARTLARRERRRRHRERSVARTESDATMSSTDERMQLLGAVISSLLRLKDFYREVLIQRYFDGRSPGRIAADLGVPKGTVQTRLKRGLALLRSELDRRLRGRREDWRGALLPFVRIPSSPPEAVVDATCRVLSIGGAIMNTKAVLASVLFLVLGGVLCWMAGDSSPAPGATTPGIGVGKEAGRLDTAADAGPGTPQGPVESTPYAPTATIPVDPAPGVNLVVVAAGSGRPLPGADVWFGDSDQHVPEPRDPAQALIEGFEPEDDSRAHATLFKTDERGEVRLPRFSNEAWVSVRHGRRWRRGFFNQATPRPYRLEIPIDQDVEVRTVDLRGRPVAGIPVMLRAFLGAGVSDFAPGTTSAPGGVHRFRHLQLNRHMWNRYRVVATLGPLFEDAPMADVVLDQPEPRALILRIPAAGRVVVNVLDAQGRPFRGPAYAGLGIERPPAGPSDRYAWWRESHWVSVIDGRAAFPQVGLGSRLRARVHVVGGERARGELVIQGPSAAGEVVTVDLRIGARFPVLVARILDHHLRPLVRGRLRVGVGKPDEASFPWLNGKHVVTGPDGGIRIPLDDEKWRAPGLELYVTTRWNTGQENREPECIGHRALPEEIPASGDIDLGSLTLHPAPLIASGHVLLGRAQPAAGVHLRLEFHNGPPHSPWSTDTLFDTYTRADGGFEIHGPCEDAPLRLQLFKDGCFSPEPILIEKGVRDLEIHIQRSGGLSGSLLLPANVKHTALYLHVHGAIVPAVMDPIRGLRKPSVARDGSFAISSLRPGRGSLTVEFVHIGTGPGEREVLVRIDDLEVEPGHTCRDVRLQGIDLRNLLRGLTVVARDEEGRPVVGAQVLVRPDAAGKPLAWRPFTTGADGRCTLPVSLGPQELSIRKKGYRTAGRSGVTRDVEVTLGEAYELRVRFPEDQLLPRPPRRLIAMCARKEVRARRPDARAMPIWVMEVQHPVDEGRSVVLELPEPGSYMLLLMLGAQGPSPSGLGITLARKEFNIGDDATSHEIRISIPGEKIRKAANASR